MPDEDEKILALMRTADPVAEYQKLYDQLEGARLQTYLGAGTMAADLIPMTYAGSRAGKAGKALAAGAPPVKRVKPYKVEESQFRSERGEKAAEKKRRFQGGLETAGEGGR